MPIGNQEARVTAAVAVESVLFVIRRLPWLADGLIEPNCDRMIDGRLSHTAGRQMPGANRHGQAVTSSFCLSRGLVRTPHEGLHLLGLQPLSNRVTISPRRSLPAITGRRRSGHQGTARRGALPGTVCTIDVLGCARTSLGARSGGGDPRTRRGRLMAWAERAKKHVAALPVSQGKRRRDWSRGGLEFLIQGRAAPARSRHERCERRRAGR